MLKICSKSRMRSVYHMKRCSSIKTVRIRSSNYWSIWRYSVEVFGRINNLQYRHFCTKRCNHKLLLRYWKLYTPFSTTSASGSFLFYTNFQFLSRDLLHHFYTNLACTYTKSHGVPCDFDPKEGYINDNIWGWPFSNSWIIVRSLCYTNSTPPQIAEKADTISATTASMSISAPFIDTIINRYLYSKSFSNTFLSKSFWFHHRQHPHST